MDKPWYSRLYIKSYVLKLLIGIVSVGAGIVLLTLLFVLEEPRMEAQEANWAGRSIETGASLYINNCSSCHGLDGRGGAGPALNSRYFFVQRLNDIGFAGSMEDYVALTVAAGRPSSVNNQWNQIMPTWSSEFGGPFRSDQVDHVTDYVMNWEQTALQQTMEEDPWIPFNDTPSQASPDEIWPEAEPVVEGPAEPRDPQELFAAMGCTACHNLDQPQTDTNRGPVGPHMGNLAERAQTAVAGLDAQEYVVQSIVAPNAHIVEGYNPNIMPQTFGQQMTEEEIQNLAAWLLEQSR